ncbi:RNA dependent RNA polymerase [Phanerochaete sordida]|uniref:RNA-dependent RNA polymerase n=1 Tax=Phanerochaete sordida TaxID=48140 RepID=A0A9P3G9L7_9APHY|nr:RNA dependent RNA polymerase [Phanerochaete sordida]
MCENAHIFVRRYTYPIRPGNIFSADVRQRYDDWLSSELFDIAFQVDAIARFNFMDLQELLRLRPHLKKMQSTMGSSYVAGFIRYLGEEAQSSSWYSNTATAAPVDHLVKFFLQCKKTFKPATMLPFSDKETFPCYHVTITPSRLLLSGPFPEKNNRVMRKYAEYTSNFLRVDCKDEEGFRYRMDRALDTRGFVRERFGGIFSKGFSLAGRHYNMLQWSQSGLKDHTFWFVKEFQMSGQAVTVKSIIDGLGLFHDTPYDPRLVYCPARLGARRAQSFTTTDAAVEVQADEILVNPDIEDAFGKRSFTDGAGLISEELMDEVWEQLQKKSRRYGRAQTRPDVIQHRFQGSKGTSTVDRGLPGRVLVIRPSMIKFEAPKLTTLEVATAFTKAGPFRLNRPLIMLFEGLQIRGGYRILEKLQDAVIQDTINATTSLSTASRLLEPHGLGTGFKVSSVFASLAKLQLEGIPDPFFYQVLKAAIYHILRDLKYHARIPVPDGYTLVGVADPYDCLAAGEVFACVTTSTNTEPTYLEGDMMITRSPGVHPGDVQVWRAIGRPPKDSPLDRHPIRNALVFPTKGLRPPASYLGGGDLDGDVYVCTPTPELLPKKLWAPADYDPGMRKEVPQPSTQQDMADFATEFICSDNIGIIASRWLEIADKSPKGIFDTRCLRLAHMHSLATDYPKTGLPVPLQDLPESDTRTGRPDWSAPETEGTGRYYQSTRYLGRLFRKVQLPEPPTPQRPRRTYGEPLALNVVLDFLHGDSRTAMDVLDRAIHDLVSPYVQAAPVHNKQRVEHVWKTYTEYLPRLRSICMSYSLHQRRAAMLSEEEVVAGTIVAQTSQPAMRKEHMSQMREQVSLLTAHIADRLDEGAGDDVYEVLKRAWIAYRLPALRPDSFGSKSFRIIALHEIFDAVKRIVAEITTDDADAADT